MTQGHATVRPGGVRHCGQAVTSGTRYIIGGFTMHRQKVEYNRMLIGLGSELASNGQFEKAKEALEAAILLNPKFDGAYTHLASVCQQLGQQEKAGQVLEYCLENVNPNNGEVAYTLGMNCFNQGSLDRARQCFELCLDLDDCDADSMMGIAQICRKKEATAEEIKWYERIIATPGVSNEVMASAYSNMGFLKVGQEEEILLLQKALEFAPSNFQLRYSLGSALASRKNWKEASECFRAAAGLAEDPEMEVKTLKLLYRVAMSEVQTSNPNGFASQQEMILALQKAMGLENYSKLASLR
mmetsp:Transcript_2559/g.3617  ORF Transcript_2559/g.3617 Transcript_2559/m.3617 type:complete len:299 (-) Transcript_2559:36-932(-)